MPLCRFWRRLRCRGWCRCRCRAGAGVGAGAGVLLPLLEPPELLGWAAAVLPLFPLPVLSFTGVSTEPPSSLLPLSASSFGFSVVDVVVSEVDVDVVVVVVVVVVVALVVLVDVDVCSVFSASTEILWFESFWWFDNSGCDTPAATTANAAAEITIFFFVVVPQILLYSLWNPQ